MSDTIQSVLRDLYSLDPELKKYEKDLVPLVEKLVEAKPSLNLDQGFVTNLRQKLMVRADELMETEKPIQANWFHRFLSPLMGGTVALAALMIGLMVWKGNQAVVQESQFISTVTEPATNELSEPLVTEAEPVPTPAPTPKTETVAKPTLAPERISDNSTPPATPVAEESAPPPSEKATFRGMDTAGVAAPSSVDDQTAILQSALKRVQAGERKITVDSKQIGTKSPKELIGLNFDYLPDDFNEIKSVLPAGYRAFADRSGGASEYYIYFENTYQWYGPFWSETN